jgi:hypothetical protein
MVLTCLALWLAAPGLAAADDPVDAQSRKIVAELVTLLDETEDVTTAVVTIRVLEKLKPHSRPALPAILRCASRLGLFRSNCRIEPARPGEELVRCQEVVLDALDSIVSSGTVVTAERGPIGAGTGALVGAAVAGTRPQERPVPRPVKVRRY